MLIALLKSAANHILFDVLKFLLFFHIFLTFFSFTLVSGLVVSFNPSL